MATTPETHISVDDRGVAWIDDTRVKVIDVALDKLAHGWSPEEIRFQHPNLSLAQVHAALAYYYDHQAALDVEIERRYQQAQRLSAAGSESPGRNRLRIQGKLP